MVQRFSDITIMFGGLWFICEVQWTAIPVHAPVGAVDYAGCFSNAGRDDRFLSLTARRQNVIEVNALLLQNWTLSLIFSAGLVAFNDDFDNHTHF